MTTIDLETMFDDSGADGGRRKLVLSPDDSASRFDQPGAHACDTTTREPLTSRPSTRTRKFAVLANDSSASEAPSHASGCAFVCSGGRYFPPNKAKELEAGTDRLCL